MTAASEQLIRVGQFSEAAEVLEETVDGAASHRALATLYLEKLGRLDRAMHHFRRSWELGRDHAAIAGLRAIHASLGDDAEVARLYEEELELAGADGRHAATLELMLGRLLARRGDLAGAARHLEASLAKAPSEEARDSLAETLAASPGPEAAARAVELCRQLAAARRAHGDLEAAAVYLRRALGIDPDAAPAAEALAEVLRQAGRWAELERLYAARGLAAERAAVLAERLGDREEAKRCWETLGEAGEAPLRALYTADGDWEKLAALVERGIDRRPPGQRADDLLSLAGLLRDRLGDRERAARCLRQVLEESPGHAEAMRRLSDHLRDRRDWRGYVELLEARVARSPEGERLARLEELAEACEQRLGDVERAAGVWRKVAELDPVRASAREALRRIGARSKMWESLITVLEREAAAAGDARDRAEVKKRMAGVFRERQVDPLRAIALYEEALALAPGDAAALKALAELYERQGDDKGLLRTLRRQLEPGAAGGGKLAPSARIERLGLLRRAAGLAEQLGDVDAVVFACTAVLDLAPGERDALDRLERVLERTGDLEGLESALAYRAEAAGGHAERARALRRLAHLGDRRAEGAPGDAALEVEAIGRWEKLLHAAPTDAEALAALATRYEEAGRTRELAAVLERLADAVRADEAAAARRRYARVVDHEINDATRAVKAWRRLLDLVPRDREALAALARRHQAAGAWRDLVDVQARQIALLAVDEPPAAAVLGLTRAAVIEEQLAAPREAAAALRDLIAHVAPAHLEAHERLVRLELAAGEHEAAARLLERIALLAPENERRAAALTRIGELARGPLGDPRRALHAFERSLELHPDDVAALATTAELYAAQGAWTHHVATLERLAGLQAPAERQRTLLALADAVELRLGDARDAFRWRRRAHELAPGTATLDVLRHGAQRHALRGELIDVLEKERQEARADRARFVALSREIAVLYEHETDAERAIAVLGEAVAAAPDDDSLHVEAERIAANAAEPAAWRAVLSVTQAALHARLGPVRARLHERRARIFDERLGEPGAALDELLAAFTLSPHPDTRPSIEGLVARTGRWDDLLRVDGTFYRLESSAAGKAQVLRRAAGIVENQLGDRVRALRGMLRALRRTPDDTEIHAELWRLAGLIGEYGVPQPAPPDPDTSLEPLFTAAPAKAAPPKDGTIQLDVGDILLDLGAGLAAGGRRAPPPTPRDLAPRGARARRSASPRRGRSWRPPTRACGPATTRRGRGISCSRPTSGSAAPAMSVARSRACCGRAPRRPAHRSRSRPTKACCGSPASATPGRTWPAGWWPGRTGPNRRGPAPSSCTRRR
jgi:tetratricopeptide (TPR) repeat protein